MYENDGAGWNDVETWMKEHEMEFTQYLNDGNKSSTKKCRRVF